MDAMHIVFPPGERAFCRVLGQAARLVDDPELKAQIATFMRQEARHASAHAQAYEHLVVRGKWSSRASKLTGATVVAMYGRKPTRFRPVLVWRVASVAVVEHLTAELGRWVFQDARFDEDRCDQRIVDLIRWHSAEEVEHRSVAFDTLQALRPGGSRLVRSAALTLWMPVVFLVWFACAQALLLDDKTAERKLLLPRRLRKAASEGLLPPLWSLFWDTKSFLAHTYHPAQQVPDEVVARVEAYITEVQALKAAQGA
jgi:predicted metal-dependent hydrolase